MIMLGVSFTLTNIFIYRKMIINIIRNPTTNNYILDIGINIDNKKELYFNDSLILKKCLYEDIDLI